MNTNKFTGTGVALITPFKKDLSLDLDSLEKIIEFNIINGVNYFVVLGTTAESATLSKEEKELIINTVKKVNNNRVPLVLGVGGNHTAEVVNELKTRDFERFDAILSVSPYYNKPTQEGIYQHFKVIAQTSPLPIILYNVPGRTSSNMLPSTVLRLANEFSNIIGIKEAAGDIVQAMKLIQSSPKDFLVISGDDMITLPMVLAGGKGVISVIAQGFPKLFSDMVQLGLNRNVDEAYNLHYKIADAIDMIFEQGNPAGIKEIFKILGICDNYVRLPLVNVENELSVRMRKFISDLN
jgi:4-hydroxy-tetrahydrodipicolinate synthase